MNFGRTIYEGPSLIDGGPIFVVALPSVHNVKTGPATQSYIMRQDMSPMEAANTGEDYSICGNCVHRGSTKDRSCYVTLFQGPRTVYNTYKRGGYPVGRPKDLPRILWVRLGTYGDPAAVPREVWDELVKGTPGWTGYSHSPHVQDLSDLCMASVETEEQARVWQAQGWSTYRTRSPGERLIRGEAQCPAAEEAAGHAVTCGSCMKCNGQKGSVSIEVHGSTHLRKRFKINQEARA